MNITIGITTYNRHLYLKRLQQSLVRTENLASSAVRIYDDCSSEISVADLRHLFPYAREIRRRTANLGADGNMRQMFVDFLATGDDVLVIMDSDLICRPDWLLFCQEHFAATDGMLSLYNSAFHKPIKQLLINGQPFVEKQHIGAAGAILARDVVQEIVASLVTVEGYDWSWCALLNKSGRRILVSKESYFQHIGLLGSHCNGRINEFGLYFHPIHDANRVILHEYFHEAVLLAKYQAALVR